MACFLGRGTTIRGIVNRWCLQATSKTPRNNPSIRESSSNANDSDKDGNGRMNRCVSYEDEGYLPIPPSQRSSKPQASRPRHSPPFGPEATNHASSSTMCIESEST
ncbi:uncharacterized protein ATNIH1004_007423 [Aspergillus tanneri]|uniref:Uncharacterized protein n=1 Tax=Aspergillus tanneri TaxID=1220188 RepID=A0A5M9MGC3_9EURO|nr:uncharacterized protein ATNIH1004_007423 [Aspergillus tanneri]KAA8646001.1 hypothetical protein ATNIH1004_007423 [Aspergillus tanneri]